MHNPQHTVTVLYLVHSCPRALLEMSTWRLHSSYKLVIDRMCAVYLVRKSLSAFSSVGNSFRIWSYDLTALYKSVYYYYYYYYMTRISCRCLRWQRHVLLEARRSGKVDWRSATTESGARSVPTTSTISTRPSPATCSDMGDVHCLVYLLPAQTSPRCSSLLGSQYDAARCSARADIDRYMLPAPDLRQTGCMSLLLTGYTGQTDRIV